MRDRAGSRPMRVRSMTGLVRFCAVAVGNPAITAQLPEFRSRIVDFPLRRPEYAPAVQLGTAGRPTMMALVGRDRLPPVLGRLVDGGQFLSPRAARGDDPSRPAARARLAFGARTSSSASASPRRASASPTATRVTARAWTRGAASSAAPPTSARLAELQERLYAEGRQSLLIVLQAMDAAGKDGTIAHVMNGLNPQGVTVTSFKQPRALELGPDFLWRHQVALPARGHIGVFNRSLRGGARAARAPGDPRPAGPQVGEGPWRERYEDIAAWESHLVRNGTGVVKFFLSVSRDEQRERFLARVDTSPKNWKFSASDDAERGFWEAYQDAYEQALRATSTPEAPWYVIPADRKWFLRTAVAAIIADHLADMDPQFPRLSDEDRAGMERAAERLRAEG